MILSNLFDSVKNTIHFARTIKVDYIVLKVFYCGLKKGKEVCFYKCSFLKSRILLVGLFCDNNDQ